MESSLSAYPTLDTTADSITYHQTILAQNAREPYPGWVTPQEMIEFFSHTKALI
jgi:hypothetical protein